MVRAAVEDAVVQTDDDLFAAGSFYAAGRGSEDVVGSSDDLLLHVPSQVSYDDAQDLDNMSHVSDDTHHSSHSQQSTRSSATSATANTTTSKRNFILENKQKLAKLNSAMKSLTHKSTIFEPSAAAKAKTANKELFSPPSSSASSTSRKSIAMTPQPPKTPSPEQPPSKKPPAGRERERESTAPGQISRHRKLNYILENKTEVKRTSEGVSLLKKHSQHQVTTRDGSVVTASVGMSTQTLAVLKQSISHETHAEFVNSNYKSLGELEGERLKELATKASTGELLSPSLRRKSSVGGGGSGGSLTSAAAAVRRSSSIHDVMNVAQHNS
eukprot:gene20707-15228_t